VFRKQLGVFTERDIAVGIVRVEPRAIWKIGAPPAPYLLYVLSGTGGSSAGRWSAGLAAELAAGEGHIVTADDELTLFYVQLPTFETIRGMR